MALRLLVLLLLVLPLLLLLLLLLRLLFCVLLLLLFLLLYVLLYLLFLLLRLPFFLLAGSANMDPRRSQNRPPGGAQMASWRPLGPPGPEACPKWPQGRSGAAPGRLLERSWRLLEPSWGALGASWGRLGVPGRPRWIDGRPFWVVFLEVCPGRLKNQRWMIVFSHFFEPLFNAFLGRLLSSLGLRRRGRAP